MKQFSYSLLASFVAICALHIPVLAAVSPTTSKIITNENIKEKKSILTPSDASVEDSSFIMDTTEYCYDNEETFYNISVRTCDGYQGIAINEYSVSFEDSIIWYCDCCVPINKLTSIASQDIQYSTSLREHKLTAMDTSSVVAVDLKTIRGGGRDKSSSSDSIVTLSSESDTAAANALSSSLGGGETCGPGTTTDYDIPLKLCQRRRGTAINQTPKRVNEENIMYCDCCLPAATNEVLTTYGSQDDDQDHDLSSLSRDTVIPSKADASVKDSSYMMDVTEYCDDNKKTIYGITIWECESPDTGGIAINVNSIWVGEGYEVYCDCCVPFNKLISGASQDDQDSTSLRQHKLTAMETSSVVAVDLKTIRGGGRDKSSSSSDSFVTLSSESDTSVASASSSSSGGGETCGPGTTTKYNIPVKLCQNLHRGTAINQTQKRVNEEYIMYCDCCIPAATNEVLTSYGSQDNDQDQDLASLQKYQIIAALE